MKIVIKLDDNIYGLLKRTERLFKYIDEEDDTVETALMKAVADGTPLPKGHGRLIDVNVLKNNIHYVPLAPIFQGDYVTYRNVIFADILDMLPTIIEAEGSDSK